MFFLFFSSKSLFSHFKIESHSFGISGVICLILSYFSLSTTEHVRWFSHDCNVVRALFLFSPRCQLITIKRHDLSACLLYVCDRDIMMVAAAVDKWHFGKSCKYVKHDRLAYLWSVTGLVEEKMTVIVGLKRSINAPLVYHPEGIYITAVSAIRIRLSSTC